MKKPFKSKLLFDLSVPIVNPNNKEEDFKIFQILKALKMINIANKGKKKYIYNNKFIINFLFI